MSKSPSWFSYVKSPPTKARIRLARLGYSHYRLASRNRRCRFGRCCAAVNCVFDGTTETIMAKIMMNRSSRNRMHRLGILSLILVCSVSTGCYNLRPNWGPQGTIGMQRNRAAANDPFPSNELGPPLAGVRPLGYEQPKAQADSLQSSPYARRGTRGGVFGQPAGF
ncbi:MAG: hypothetical protein ACI814_001859 [Mariniblastus sp.]|jgi:hypothetical protein